ncbi:neurotransmitter:Na+ symporter, NSS family [Maridesulfovibrio ferrireducens]|uniref:Transporter n=1 Tax=Maridesulfovibrio ferrireducens TaxID=246191 RepID=A0A1G9C879_9BACT|nr:sodium-dependent transporter [Maridesulfovibrio ferrireducens]SDK47872.1 neurotransmitter:Na+ symporter, NSS family [Maridesulfovibrio ferrireducens]
MQKRETWGSRSGFILAAVGSAIGLGNIWRFPYIVYENGGGAFLIPYFVAMLAAGIPFMILEFGLGQKFKGSAPKIFASISKRWEWLGWWQIMVAFIIDTYYVVVIAWAMNYLILSFTQGWGMNPKDFFYGDFLHLSNSPMEVGGIQWAIFAATATAWFCTFLAVFTGVKKGIERANKIFMPLLFLLVFIFIARGLMLPGAADGLNWLFKPDFSALLKGKVWADAFGQIFYSLSIGFAIMLAYSSYLPKKSDITNNACMTVFINCGFSMLSGIMIFSVLGYMALQQGVPVSDVTSSGVGLAFITLPTAINLMPMPVFFGVMFFLALVVAGLSSMISITEAVVSAIIDKLNVTRQKAAIIFCLIGFLISIMFTTGSGLLLLDIVDHFVNNFGILIGGFIEIIFIAWFCDLDALSQHINTTSELKVGGLWKTCLRYIVPVMLGFMVINNFIGDLQTNYGGYSNTAIILFGWAVLFVCSIFSMTFAHKDFAFVKKSENNHFLKRR